MPKTERFEQLIAWQKARELTKTIYSMSKIPPMSADRGFSSQIQRAAVSIMSNIAEGFERGRLTEFHQYLSTAKASCAEVRSQLYVAYDTGYLAQSSFNEAIAKAEEVTRIIAGLRKAVALKRKKQREH